MAAGRLLIPGWARALDSEGFAIAARVSLFNTGTDALATVYADEGLTTPLANPVQSNSAGRFPAIWASDANAYDWSVEAPYGPPGSPFTGEGLTTALAADVLTAEAAEAAASDAQASADAAEAFLQEALAIEASGSDAAAIAARVPYATLAASGGGALVGVNPGGTGAVTRTLQAHMDELSISVASFGAVADGSTNNGLAFRRALARAVALGYSLYIPPSTLGFVTDMVTATAPIRVWGHNSKVIVTWSAESQAAGLVGGTYKASPFLLFKPGAAKSVVEGLEISQDATFPTTYDTPSGYQSGATFATIIGQRANELIVRNCRFATTTGRAIYLRGGDYARVQGNTFVNSSVVMHIGETSLVQLWDASTVTTTRYSPAQPLISGNMFVGSNTTRLARHSVFLTGTVSPMVTNNQFTQLTADSDGENEAIRIYANDDGTFNKANVNISTNALLVANNIIDGTVKYGISYVGDTASSGSDVTPLGSFTGNVINVTGAGIEVEYGPGLRIEGNYIRSTGSVLFLADALTGMKVVNNHLECTTNGASDRTIAFGSTATLHGVDFVGNTIVTPADDEFVMDLVTGAGVTLGFKNSRIANNTFVFASSVATCRPLQLGECSGTVEITGNIFDIRHAAMSGRFCVSIAEQSGQDLTVILKGNTSGSSTGVSFGRLGAAINSGNRAIISENDIGTFAVNVSDEVICTANRFTSSTAAQIPLEVSGTTKVVCTGNIMEATTANNVAGAAFDACGRTIFTGNMVKTNSTTAQIRCLTSGVVQAQSNTTENASSGAPYGVSGTGKIAGDLGGLYNVNGAVAWADANRLAASSTEKGTRFINSTDNDWNISNGTDWYANGAVT